MPEIQFGAGAYLNDSFNLPDIDLENWMAEEAPDRAEWGYRLIPTPGLVAHSDTSDTKGRGATQSDSIANGQIIAVHDSSVYRVDSAGVAQQLGSAVIDDDLPVRFAASQVEMALVSGAMVYEVLENQVVDFTANLTGAGASGDIIDVDVINNRHVFVEEDSGRLFYSDPGDMKTIGGFVTAESDPDFLKGVLNVGGSLLLFGGKRTEVWTGTDSSTAPLVPRQGNVFEKGIINSRAKASLDGVAYWASHDAGFYSWSGVVPQRLSPHWMERALEGLSTADKELVRVSSHTYQGHKFVNLHIPGKGDFFLDILTGRWHRRKALGNDVTDWGFDYFVESFGKLFVQKLSDGMLYRVDSTVFTEDGSNVRRVASAVIPVRKSLTVQNVIIEGQAGVGLMNNDDEEGDPTCELRVAYDGKVFAAPHQVKIGKIGEHSWRPTLGPLGLIEPPVVKFEISYADAVGWSLYGASFNERAF